MATIGSERTVVAVCPLISALRAAALLHECQSSRGVELLGPDGLLSQVTKAVLERALEEERPSTWAQSALKVFYLAVRNLDEYRGATVGIRSSG